MSNQKYDHFKEPIYHSHNPAYGDYKIIDIMTMRDNPGQGFTTTMAKIRFLNTGTETITALYNAKIGAVRDAYAPIIYGVGYTGNASKAEYPTIYSRWLKMLSRCYNKNDAKYRNYGAKGITVCERWFSFENYLNDLSKMENFDKLLMHNSKWQVDKDFLQQDMTAECKIYSPETCCIIPATDNSLWARFFNKTNKTYFGVGQTSSGMYTTSIYHDGENMRIGNFTNEEAAATVYNFYAKWYHHNIINDTNMDLVEALKYRTTWKGKHRKLNVICNNVMCKDIKDILPKEKITLQDIIR